jgi:2'-5' RNA ligase
MQYYIAHIIKGDAAIYHCIISKHIAEVFNERKYLEKQSPCHITLIPPFSTQDISAVESIVARIALSHEKTPMHLRSFGHFRNSVIYWNPEVGDEVHNIRNELLEGMAALELVGQSSEMTNWNPHATIAYASKDNFDMIWDYIISLPAEEFEAFFDSIAILKREDGGWEVHKEFSIGFRI